MPFYRNFPGQRIFDMKKHFDRLYEEFVRDHESADPDAGFMPALNLENSAGEYIVTIELPGVDRKDVQILFQEGKLLISGVKKADGDVQKRDFLRFERDFGKFYRQIPVEGKIKEDKISAGFKDGILEIRLPKEQKDQAKKVKINIK